MNDGQDTGNGLTYEEYLRILLFLEKKEAVGMRALDLIENNLRTKHGMTSFRADQCVSKMEMDSTCKLRRGIPIVFLRILDITDKKNGRGGDRCPFGHTSQFIKRNERKEMDSRHE